MHVERISWFTNQRPPPPHKHKRRFYCQGPCPLALSYLGPFIHTRTHALDAVVYREGGSEGIKRWTSRLCWERWPAQGLLAPVAEVFSAALAPPARFLASPTPSAGLHSQTEPEKQEYGTLTLVGTPFGFEKCWCDVTFICGALNWKLN